MRGRRRRRRGPTRPEAFFAADPAFASAFAAFLRQHPDLWRTRRLDHFCPLDLRLAEHRITVQGRIDPSIVERFLRTEGSVLNIRRPDVAADDELTVYVPVARFPKRIFLNFSIRSETGGTLSLLTRSEGATVGALNLLSLLFQRGWSPSRSLLKAFYIVLATLLFQNPGGLAERIEEWRSLVGAPFPGDGPLPLPNLRKWVQNEGEAFLSGLGRPLCRALDPLLRDISERRIPLTPMPSLRQNGLEHFDSLESLLVHSIRDLLKLTIEYAPAWQGRQHVHGPTREELMGDPEVLARHVAAVPLRALRELENVLQNEREGPVYDALRVDVDSWTGYVVMRIRLGIPFNVKLSESIPLDVGAAPQGPWWMRILETWFRGSWRVSQDYPLPIKDASSVHVEVAIPAEIELRIAPSTGRLTRDVSLVASRRNATTGRSIRAHGALRYAFGTYTQPSDRLLHLYSSRRLDEAAHRDIQLNAALFLYVPLRLTRAIWLGYLFASIAFLLAAFYIARYAVPAWWQGTSHVNLGRLVTIGALATTLSLWMANPPSRRPIINRMLLPARLAFFIALAVTIGSLGIPGVVSVVRSSPLWVDLLLSAIVLAIGYIAGLMYFRLEEGSRA